jgi:hypothetical protein
MGSEEHGKSGSDGQGETLQDGPAAAASAPNEAASHAGADRDSEDPSPKEGWLTRLLKASAATVALVVALVSLVFSLVPNLRPSEPPEKLGGQIQKADIEHGVWRRDYERLVLHNEASRDESFSDSAPGMLVRARVELSGFKARHYRMMGLLYDVKSGRFHEYALQEHETIGSSGQDLRPSASTDAVVFQLWIRNPTHSGRYFIRLRLYDVGEERPTRTEGDPGPLLDYLDTPPFSYKYNPLGSKYSPNEFEGDGSYTINGELRLGTYELAPPRGSTCSWTKLPRGGDPDSLDSEHTIASGDTTKRARISLDSGDHLLVLRGCGHVRLIAEANG